MDHLNDLQCTATVAASGTPSRSRSTLATPCGRRLASPRCRLRVRVARRGVASESRPGIRRRTQRTAAPREVRGAKQNPGPCGPTSPQTRPARRGSVVRPGSRVKSWCTRPAPLSGPPTLWPSLSKRAVHASGAGPEPAPAMPAPREARGRAQREAERRPKPTGRARKAARVTNDTELETLQDCLRITTVSRERRRKPANGRARQPPARAASLHARGPTAGHAQARLASTA